jgi:hypothetical protein
MRQLGITPLGRILIIETKAEQIRNNVLEKVSSLPWLEAHEHRQDPGKNGRIIETFIGENEHLSQIIGGRPQKMGFKRAKELQENWTVADSLFGVYSCRWGDTPFLAWVKLTWYVVWPILCTSTRHVFMVANSYCGDLCPYCDSLCRYHAMFPLESTGHGCLIFCPSTIK